MERSVRRPLQIQATGEAMERSVRRPLQIQAAGEAMERSVGRPLQIQAAGEAMERSVGRPLQIQATGGVMERSARHPLQIQATGKVLKRSVGSLLRIQATGEAMESGAELLPEEWGPCERCWTSKRQGGWRSVVRPLQTPINWSNHHQRDPGDPAPLVTCQALQPPWSLHHSAATTLPGLLCFPSFSETVGVLYALT